MKILGVDPGLKITGYGLLEFDEKRNHHFKLLEAGIIQSKSRDLIQNKLNNVYKNLNDLILQYHPNVMVLEKLYSHQKHPTTSSIMGHVRGVICLLCSERQIELSEQSVKRIRKSLLGTGSASKKQTLKIVAHTLNLDESKLTVDTSDALALALGYIQQLRCKI